MSQHLANASRLPRQACNFASGVLLGMAFVTPVFAATGLAIDNLIAVDNLSIPILVGSLILLAIAVALKMKRHTSAAAAKPEPPNGFSEGIGRYRLSLGRSDAD